MITEDSAPEGSAIASEPSPASTPARGRAALRRALGPDNLVTLTEICVELRVGKPMARQLVAGLASCQRGKARLYRWREVLAAAFNEPAAAAGGDAPPAPRYAGPRAKL